MVTIGVPVNPRKTYGAGPSRASGGNRPKLGFLHHSAGPPGRQRRTFRQMAAVVRGFYLFHVNGRGWSDIAYHYIVFQPFWRLRPVVFQGRPADRMPSANPPNTGTLAICVVGTNERLLERTAYVVGRLFKRHGISPSAIRGHRDQNATDCPGDLMYSALPRVRKYAR